MEKGFSGCDDKYYPGHKCRNRYFKVMIASKDEREDKSEEAVEEEGFSN